MAFGNGGRFFVPANPVARIFKGTANDSPSPWGEGRVEGDQIIIALFHADIIKLKNEPFLTAS
jgi:hypothetical protein